MNRPLLLCALLGLTACFEDGPPQLAAPDETTGEAETTITPTTAPPPPSSASSTSIAASGSDDESSGDPSSTSGSSDPSTDDSGSESESSSSTGPAPYDGPYGDCWEGPVQTEEGEYLCAPSSCVVDPPLHSACAPPCGAGCEPGPDDVAGACLAGMVTDTVPEVCVIPCAPGCPTGMECAPTEFTATEGGTLWLCMWP